ncbi:uncharacterized protein CC84DRAFT_48667 [Paraphaeosphaeria sporulosa]|uniref:Concanavalin A-like lectin/glucanase n=1 Tax=Paraphaeosphaeria sporulosa TaxID=1460663 RepID=A0A177CX22_9PLEO|nr:uncharacterized protein CC84DRAFT_48667 [Paraphaeosphaeria sporulosa]OAG11751.1 hypothetical protein CC84DRAFT_48667 [Paraphaeosphaeria sporulosa]
MKTIAFALSATALANAAAIRRQNDYGYQFSNALSTGPVATNSFIREANTTLILPETNSPQTGNLALWPGMGTSGGDLIQGLAISVSDGSAGCEKSSGKWCIVASTLEDTQQMGKFVTADPGSSVTFHYKYNDGTAKYDQTVSLDGTVVSTLSTDSGKAQGWGTAVECQQAACGTVPAHKYVDTTLIMDVADPNYEQTKGVTGATGDLVTADGGKTWTIETISIESHTYT